MCEGISGLGEIRTRLEHVPKLSESGTRPKTVPDLGEAGTEPSLVFEDRLDDSFDRIADFEKHEASDTLVVIIQPKPV